MKNLIIFLSAFTLTVLAALFASVPANAGGAGGSWTCPDGWTTKADGSCSFNGGGGGSSGGGSGGDWSPFICSGGGKTAKSVASFFTAHLNSGNYDAQVNGGTYGYTIVSVAPFAENPPSFPISAVFREAGIKYGSPYSFDFNVSGVCTYTNEPNPDIPPDFPDIPPPDPDCNVCQSLYDIRLKINHLKNQDINNITNITNDMSNTVNNIDNSINDLSVNQDLTNNHLTNIDNSMGDIITNIENNNITQNEIKNEINNIYETMNDYSLQLGNIELAMGDIDLSLKNTNKLVLDLGLDMDFIKNKLINDTSKDYTPYLNDIIGLLSPCVPTVDIPCPAPSEVGGYDDTALIALLTDMQEFMKADFVPGDDFSEVEVTDLTDIKLDRNLINFGAATCPPDNEFNTTVNGFAFSGGFKHKPLCDFFTMLAPFIKAFAGFSAALILGGGLRR